MNVTGSFGHWTDAYASVVFEITWQSSVIAAALLLAVRLGRRWPSPLRYGLLVLGLVRFALPPLPAWPTGVLPIAGRALPQSFSSTAPSSTSLPFADQRAARARSAHSAEELAVSRGLEHEWTPERTPAGGSEAQTGGFTAGFVAPGPAEARSSTDPMALARTYGLWIHVVGTALLAAWAARQMLLLRRLCRHARRVDPDDPVQAAFTSLAQRLGLRRVPILLIHDGAIPPMALGLLRRRVLLPAAILDRLAPRELQAVLAHELAHHRRSDLWINWAQLVLAGVWWFNPVVWLLNREIRRVREECCDDVVLGLRGADAESYGRTLVHVARELSRPVLLGGALGFAARLHPLGRRIERIMDGTLRHSGGLSLAGALLLAAAALTLLPGFEKQQTDRPGSAAAHQPTGEIQQNNLPAALSAATPSTDGSTAPQATPSDKDEPKPTQPPAVPASPPPQDPQTASAEDARRIIITVLDAATDEPVEGADVTVQGSGDKQSGQTDVAGRYTATVPQEIKRSLSLRAARQGYVGQYALFASRAGQPLTIPPACTLRLTKAEMIRGRVTDPEGKPIADVKVELRLRAQMHEDGTPFLSDSFTTTDADGGFGIQARIATGLDDLEMYHVDLDHPNYLPTSLHDMANAKPPVLFSLRQSIRISDLLEGRAVFTLDPDKRVPFRLSGRVVDEEEKPLAEARIQLLDIAMPQEHGSTQTDREGRFALEVMPPRRTFNDKVRLIVEKDGFAAQIRLIGFEPRDGLDFTLGVAEPIRGIVVDAQPKPLEGARVNIAQEHPAGYPNKGWAWAAKTGPDGRFECLSAPEGTLNLLVDKTDLQPFRQTGTLRGTPITAMLGPAVCVEGRVTSKVDGRPLPAFTVVLGTPSSQGRVVWQTSGIQPAPYHQGVYRMPLSQYSSIEVFKLRVEAEGFRPVESPLMTVGAASLHWDAVLEPEGRYTGRIVGADQSPVAGANVYGWVGDGNDIVTVRDLLLDTTYGGAMRSWTTQTDTEGRFTLPHVDDLVVLLATHESGSAVVHRPSPTVEDVTLQPWGRIEGRVFHGERPDAGRALHTYTNAPHEPQAPTVNFVFETRCDDQGRFAIRSLPGWAHLSALNWGDEQRAGTRVRPEGFRNLWSTWAGVDSDRCVVVDLGRGGRTVTGRILGIDMPQAPWWSRFTLIRKMPDAPAWARGADGKLQGEGYEKWIRSAEYLAERVLPTDYELMVAADGRFTIANVVAGDFFIDGRLEKLGDYPSEVLGRTDREKVYTVPADGSREPIDLGDIPLLPPEAPPVQLAVGQPAPDFSVTTLDGQALRLAELKGKVVVLDFWATWCGPCMRELPFLIDAHQRFGRRGDVIFMGLSLDKSAEELKRGVAERGIAWPQALVTDPAGQQIQKAYGVTGIPHVVLVGKSGLIEGNHVFGEGLATALEAALARSEK